MIICWNKKIVIALILLSFFIIPVSARTIGNGGSAWSDNSTMDNVTEDLGDSYVKVGVFADNFNDGNYNGWIVFSKPSSDTSDGLWSASNGYLKVSGGTTPRWHSLKYNTPLQQNISFKYDFNIIGSQEYAAQFWDIDSGTLWFNFIDINNLTIIKQLLAEITYLQKQIHQTIEMTLTLLDKQERRNCEC